MDNNSPTQPTQPMPPVQPLQPAMPTVQTNPITPPPVAPSPVRPVKDHSDLIKTIIIVAISLIAATFIGLFVWMTLRCKDAEENVDTKVSQAVLEAKKAQAEELEAKFAEDLKYPYNTFAGPVDYGELSFEYPKTWSVYIEADASKGGDYRAYLNPLEVNPVSNSTINALRVSIFNRAYESVISEYSRNEELQVSVVTVNGFSGNRYVGTIPNTDLKGIIVVLKIRDKTAILQTDSMLFEEEFDKLLGTVKFNS